MLRNFNERRAYVDDDKNWSITEETSVVRISKMNGTNIHKLEILSAGIGPYPKHWVGYPERYCYFVKKDGCIERFMPITEVISIIQKMGAWI